MKNKMSDLNNHLFAQPGNVRALCPACRADGGWTRQVQWGGRK